MSSLNDIHTIRRVAEERIARSNGALRELIARAAPFAVYEDNGWDYGGNDDTVKVGIHVTVRELRQLRAALEMARQTALLLLLLLVASASASASPSAQCLDLAAMPATVQFASATHIEVGVWHEAEAGCGATGERATTTAGPYEVRYLDHGAELLTFFAAGFEQCGRSQADVRWRGQDGELYRYADFIVNTGRDCPRFGTETGQGATNGGDPPPDSVPPGDSPTPVPEASTWSYALIGLLSLWWVRR